MRRRFCVCGRVIWRGTILRRCGAGVAQYWVRSDEPMWRHIDDRTEACEAPGGWAA